MGFRENLKAELEYQDIRTKDLADKAGVQKRTIDHYLMNNPQEPSVTNAFKIAQALNVSVEYLMTGREIQGKLPLTKELVDFINGYLTLNSKKQAVIKEMVEILHE
ncbi:helix-turn-helix transcriptional regulator [uncultured Treponema sp.]|uniref:helix-turn-helix domain-containing protein n=1 Tax=uncultured Treponema sp. TaxID=162155 RepID=UPI0025CBED78|nr:helix-turn-helix transcriptional regulator [uncultured Treponema sp.]